MSFLFCLWKVTYLSMICKGCCSALLTQQALDKPQPDKFRVIKQKWNSLLFHINKKEIPKHINVVPLNSITIFFYSQAGKHRLFLNILLFGKLLFPIWKLFLRILQTFQQAALVSDFFPYDIALKKLQSFSCPCSYLSFTYSLPTCSQITTT